MKDLAQAAYEAFSSSLNIGEVVEKPPKTRVGPMPWDTLPIDSKRRWQLVVEAIIKAHGDNAIEAEKRVLATVGSPPQPVNRAPAPIDAPDTRKEQALAAEVLPADDSRHPIVDGIPDQHGRTV